MAEIRKRNTKAPATEPAAIAEVQQQVSTGNNIYYVLLLIVSGIAALAVSYFQFQSSSSTPETSSTTPIPSPPSTSSANGKLQLTDEQLSAFTGADPDTPIYVALNGTIFDVSSSPSFYGPGGHYGHFAGRDATRAWVTTCFEPEYLTWDMKGVEAMFAPKWMDEEMEAAAAGKLIELSGGIQDQAATLLKKVGKVSKAEKEQRRLEDADEIKQSIEEAMAHWMDFFKNNPKYAEVGIVVGRKPLDDDRADIGVCEEAMKKRPFKGGRFGDIMEKAASVGAMGGQQQGQKAPDFVKGKGV